MRANIDRFLPCENIIYTEFRRDKADSVRPFAVRTLLLLGVLLLMLLSSNGQSLAAGQTDGDNSKDLDSRWFPWIGSWRLISNTVNEDDSSLEGEFLLKIEPGNDYGSIAMTGSQDGLILFDRKMVTIGSRQPIADDGCTGWYEHSWSDTGRHPLFHSESKCAEGPRRIISGISIFTGSGKWSDIHLTQSGEEKIITIRRYKRADSNWIDPRIEGKVVLTGARAGSTANLSINEVIELTGKVAPEVMEAALLELHQPFEINAKTLGRLADADVPPQIVDLMVALSFPDRFIVERRTIAPTQRPKLTRSSYYGTYPGPSFGFWSLYDPWFPYYWASSYCWLFGYWGSGWGAWLGWGYPGWGYPGWGYSGWGWPYYPGGGYAIDRGRLIANQGYSRVKPRDPGSGPRSAHPRNSPSRYAIGGGSIRYQAGARSSASSAHSRSGSSGGSAGRNGGSRGGSPNASPRGYSGGGGGRTARSR